MPHPLLPNLKELSDEELSNKVNDLHRKLQAAYRMGYSEAVYQLQVLLQDYSAEHQDRQQKQLAELMEKASGGEYKNIININ